MALELSGSLLFTFFFANQGGLGCYNFTKCADSCNQKAFYNHGQASPGLWEHGALMRMSSELGWPVFYACHQEKSVKMIFLYKPKPLPRVARTSTVQCTISCPLLCSWHWNKFQTAPGEDVFFRNVSRLRERHRQAATVQWTQFSRSHMNFHTVVFINKQTMTTRPPRKAALQSQMPRLCYFGHHIGLYCCN